MRVAVGWAVLCAVLSGGAVVAHLLASGHDEGVFRFFYADAIVGATFPVVGALVAWREPRNITAVVLAAGGLVGVSAASHELVYHVEVAGGGSPWVAPVAWLAMWTWAGYWVQPTLLPLLFPGGTLPSTRWRPVLWSVLGLLALSATAAAFRPGEIDGIASPLVENPLGLGRDHRPFIVVQSVTSMLVALPGSAVCIAAFFSRRRGAAGRARAQLDWLFLGFLTCLILLGLVAALGDSPLAVRDALFAAAFAAIPTSVAVAVWRHQLLGVDAFLRRVALYGALAAIAAGSYGLVVTGASLAGIGGHVSAPASAVAVVVASALRTLVRSFVDRRLFGVRHDPLAVIALMNDTHATGDALAAVSRVVATVADGLALPSVAVIDAATGDTLVTRGRSAVGVVEVPITAEGRHLATLAVGRRPREDELPPAVYTALVTAAQRIGAIMHTDAIARDLQRIREQLVTAREEERRRLRRDLHDGVGPSLAGMALQVETLAHRLGPESELAERALGLRKQLQETAREVRRLVNGLRPAPVDDLGLGEALRELAQLDGDNSRVVVRVADDLPALPAAVESSAYRLTAEAVTNSLRHGCPSRCVVDVRVVGDWLTVEVRDDGSGFGPETASGMGLQSMHERTAEIGGELVINSAPGNGTSVLARLPWGTP